MILFREMEPITKLLDKNLSQLRYEETVTRGCFGPFLAVQQILAIQYMCYSSAICGLIHGLLYLKFFLYKSELLQIETILVVIDVAIKLLLLLRILRNLWTVGGPSLALFFLGMNVCDIYHSWY